MLYYQATNHSALSVQLNPNYIDASTQPSVYKFYPKFYRRFSLEDDNPVHSLIQLTSAITLEKVEKNWQAQLRVNPSAGGLYPTEVYVQIRGIKGIIDGIYHLEVANSNLTLIYELIDDGLESYICPGKTVKGLIFLVSCVYFRSSWKYQDRSLRYCFLDSGHHLGAIEAAAYLHHQNMQVIFDFDKLALNEDLGFENKEFVTGCAVVGEYEENNRRRLRLKVPFVSGTDYFEANDFIEQGYRDTLEPNSNFQPVIHPQFNYQREFFLETVLRRRSARRFRRESIKNADFQEIFQEIIQPISTESFEDIEIYSVVNRVEGMEVGIYRGSELIKPGDFSQKAGYLCVNQGIARDGAVTLFFVSAYQNYQTVLQLAGFIGQRVYLASNYRGIGCSGIGAYYDEETKEFLGTDKSILYAVAIGVSG
ncbi:MAG: nitroreductase family protein [Microcoleaceae cyanobacterium]